MSPSDTRNGLLRTSTLNARMAVPRLCGTVGVGCPAQNVCVSLSPSPVPSLAHGRRRNSYEYDAGLQLVQQRTACWWVAPSLRSVWALTVPKIRPNAACKRFDDGVGLCSRGPRVPCSKSQRRKQLVPKMVKEGIIGCCADDG